eukprot:9330342-Heterocapsa_arctica.AAC.1
MTAGRLRCRRHGAAAIAPCRNIETSKIAGIEKEKQLEQFGRDPADIELNDDEEPDTDIEPLEGHARAASPQPLATAPSPLEQVKHCLTHLPFQRWCAHCVKARAQDQAHYSQKGDEKRKAEPEL